jgi:hypothetical protein
MILETTEHFILFKGRFQGYMYYITIPMISLLIQEHPYSNLFLYAQSMSMIHKCTERKG